MSIANTNEHLREVMISREMFLHDLNTEKQAARKAGLEEGLEKGLEKGQALICLKMQQNGMSLTDIAKMTGLSEKKVLELIEIVSNNPKVCEPPAKYKPRKPSKPQS